MPYSFRKYIKKLTQFKNFVHKLVQLSKKIKQLQDGKSRGAEITGFAKL